METTQPTVSESAGDAEPSVDSDRPTDRPKDRPKGARAGGSGGDGASRGTVAYIAHYFPALSQTFVYREIRALEALGWDVEYFSIRRPEDTASGDAAGMSERTFYLFPFSKLKLVGRLCVLFCAHPIRFLKLLFSVALARGESWKARRHGLSHFLGGMYLVPEVKRCGARHFHAHFGKNPATLAMVVSEYLQIPFSMTIHATDLFVSGLLLRQKLARCKFVASISEYNLKLLSELADDPKVTEKIHVLHCGIDLDKFPVRETPPEETTPLVIAVGRLVEKKGYPVLLDAVKLLKDRGLEFRVRVIGGGPDREALEQQCDNLGIGDYLSLDGAMPQEELLPILKQADVFVLPCVRAGDGDQDGIPVSLMEAMAYGIVCVSSRLSGIPELIEDGENGLLTEERDVEGLAEALGTLLEDRELRLRMGQAARTRVEESFSLTGLAKELDRLFRR